MRLKYLTLCLMGLSLSACSQHVIKTNPATVNLEQKAVNSLNAIYEYPSYDYRGKFNIHVDQEPSKNTAKAEPASLEPALKQKVDQYLREQRVNLNNKQKQALYTALAQQQKSAGRSKADKFTQVMANILNEMQFEYEGSVHYRQKMGSLNLTARYEKPTLLVQAKVPMVLDLNHYKFYINYFALMPYLVNKDNQNKLAYLDFSKYQDAFKQVDYKKFAEYVKASSAVYYRLADQKNIQALSVSSVDQAAGVVEKIRLKTSVEELILQANLYSKVNEKYLMQSVLNLNAQNLEKLVVDEVANAEQAKSTASLLDAKDSADDASLVSQQLYRLVNQHFGVENIEEADADESADTAEAAAARAAAAAADDPKASEYPEESDDLEAVEDEQAGLSEQQCTALQTAPKTTYGDVQYCQSIYGIDVFSDQPVEPGFLTYIQKLQAVEKEFAVYDQNQFIDDQAFKALWLKHQADIEKALPPVDKRNPFVMDVGLDAKGRAVKIDYDLNYGLPELKSRFNIKADMLISNYGKGTPIDQAQLKQAKTWAEASKGSMLEQAVNSFSEKLGQAGIQERSAEPYRLSLDDQLNLIAEQRYDATRAYEPTYKAVFIAKLTENSPHIVQRYSSQELQEIAAVYAYWYADEDVYNPEGKALQKIETLQNKHHLQDEDQFDDSLGRSVYHIVSEAMQGEQDRQAWKKLQAQYKQPQQLFAKQYQIQFEQENGASSEEKVLLAQTANILGQVYVDARKNRLSEQSIKALKIEHNEFIDYEIFKQVYQKMLNLK
ncbi:hypothetical protein [Acinetobacter courvalinii]|uniref:Uncharacterized protein n=1 Tax=Acinetobacter courvalinii TaxID=280147 RepID=N9RNH8_9GAMM|nr:hypothetical protein [Acinetobacter courvalinii]ENX40235.1 hypothetical protein F888_00882 [Acinetobacter courvalinii]KAB0660907.1 hypothetical protein F7P77_04395 [Acinetobacter courvalinii]RSN82451.1 hypothetical protein EA770_08385 [Acinetobacter baumannii]GGH37839.1 hypothetical protein GCM10007354_22610 [Acinetobacter courvalinii]